jgi:hypothetical protein
MTFEIRLILDQSLQPEDIVVGVDDQPVQVVFEFNHVVVRQKHEGFLHLLKLTNVTGKRFSIQQVQVGGCDVRKLIYLSHVENSQGHKFQPATELWESGQTWVLPFGYPLSGWLELVEKKIVNDLFGKNLLDQFEFYYPQSLILDPARFPQMVRDFYQHNFGFTMLNRQDCDAVKIPYMTYCKSIDNDLVSAAEQEVNSNLDYVMAHGLSYSQYKSNLEEYQFESTDQCWRIIWLSRDREATEAAALFPQVKQLVDSLGLDHWYVFIGVLPPGGFIYPHLDYDTNKASNPDYRSYQGCTQLYIPLSWPAHNYIKFAGAGILSLESGQAMVINNDNFVHSVVNASNQNRIVLSVRSHQKILDDCDWANK